jgi:hypothetical protein
MEAWQPSGSPSYDLKAYMGERLTAALPQDTFYLRQDPLTDQFRPVRLSGEDYKRVRLEAIAEEIKCQRQRIQTRVQAASDNNRSNQQLANELDTLRGGMSSSPDLTEMRQVV